MLEQLYQISRIYLQTNNFPYHRSSFQAANFLSHRLSILAGPRGVGKTTLIVQKLLNAVDNHLLSPNILYVPSDHLLISQTSLYEIAEQFMQYGGKWIAFDEIHKYKNWSQELKSIYETFPNLHLFVSGSSLIELHKGSHDLTRRSIVYHLDGLSFREYLGLRYDIQFKKIAWDTLLQQHETLSYEIIQSITQKSLKILPLFKDYLIYGYYPYFLELNDPETYHLTLEQNMIATIETDIPAVYPTLTGQSLRKIKQILTFLSTNVPFKPNYKQLQTTADITDLRTLKTYLKYLEDAHLIRQVGAEGSKFQAIEHAEKLYLHNPNQYYALSNTPNIGTIRELFFLCSINRKNELTIPKTGDFLVDKTTLFEIGGRKKDYTQIKGHPAAYLACDDLEIGAGHRIPLWLFGFLN